VEARVLKRLGDLARLTVLCWAAGSVFWIGCRPAQLPSVLAFDPPRSPAQVELLALVESCGQASPAFTRMLVHIRRSGPLRTVAADADGPTLFGSAHAQNDEPLLTIDVGDLRHLPLSVTGWGGDSNWALTRCEVLGHEVSEAFHYRRAWLLEDSTERAGGFTRRVREAHRAALETESEIARDLKHGQPSAPRTAVTCARDTVLYSVIGKHTEVVVLDRDQQIRAIRYLADTVACPLSHDR
jgi:hypothetical protein